MSLVMLSVPGKCSKEQESLGAWWITNIHHWYSIYINDTNTSAKYALHKTFFFIGSLSSLVREKLGHIKGKFLDQKFQPLSELHFPKSQRSLMRESPFIGGERR